MNLSQPLLDAISAYRHPRLARPDVGGVYALFPHDPVSVHVPYRWPQTWPHSDRPGVYLILDRDTLHVAGNLPDFYFPLKSLIGN
jgi:hypothetical protein